MRFIFLPNVLQSCEDKLTGHVKRPVIFMTITMWLSAQYINIFISLLCLFRVLMVDILIRFRVQHILGYKLRLFRGNSDIFITFRVHQVQIKKVTLNHISQFCRPMHVMWHTSLYAELTHAWHNATHGTMRPMAQCGPWHSVTHGTVRLVVQCNPWHNATVAMCHGWHSGTVRPMVQCDHGTM